VVLVGAAVGLYFLYAPSDIDKALERGEWVSILVVGVDDGHEGAPQADAIHVVGVGPESFCVFSFPRDTLVRRDGKWVPLYALYTPDLSALREAMSELLEKDVTYQISLGYSGFVELVNRVGGVDLDVDHHLVYVDQSQGLVIDIPEGHQHLDGETALKFVRYREDADEYGRIARQRQFLLALGEKLRRTGLRGMKALVQFALSRVETNLSLWDILSLWRRFRDRPDQGGFISVPGYPSEGGLKVDLVKLRKRMAACEEGKAFYTRDEVKLVVLNGVGVRFLAHRAKVWLEDRGFQVLRIGDAPSFAYTKTTIVDLKGDPKKVALVRDALSVAGPLEVAGEGEVEIKEFGSLPTGADVLVILGKGISFGG